MDRAIVRHVRWHVHPAGTGKPPLAPESDYYTDDEEEDGVSVCRLGLWLYILRVGHAHRKLGQLAPTDSSGTTP